MLNDPLSNTLSKINNAEKLGKQDTTMKISSKTIKEVLRVMRENNYVGEYKEIPTARGNMLKVSLLGQINKCGTIKPRFSVKKENYVKYEKRYLPSRGFGILIITTPKGIMTHEEAKKQNVGGSLLAYCY
jgi:small subunit ribosomal protein S8